MWQRKLILLCFLLFKVYLVSSAKPCVIKDKPRQIHLSFGNDPYEIVVTWISFENTQSWVHYGENDCDQWKQGVTTPFVDEGPKRKIRYVHRVNLKRLQPSTTYRYRCGSKRYLSPEHRFHTIPSGYSWSPQVIIYGDMGVPGAVTLPSIIREAKSHHLTAVLHIGDMGYNLDTNNGDKGDKFFDMIEPLASRVPYMTVPGNHEQAHNFSHYRERLTMPGNTDNYYYSFNLGPAHFVGISTEVYFFHNYGYRSLQSQFNWLRSDLREAALRKNRRRRPWIILYGHRPMYCVPASNYCHAANVDCLRYATPMISWYSLEELMHDNKVDVAFWGHLHIYERSWPIYNDRILNGSHSCPYRDPRATVHIITGAAGMSAGTDELPRKPGPWSAFRSRKPSYTRLSVVNYTHLLLEQVSKRRKVIDSVWISKSIKEKTDGYSIEEMTNCLSSFDKYCNYLNVDT